MPAMDNSWKNTGTEGKDSKNESSPGDAQGQNRKPSNIDVKNDTNIDKAWTLHVCGCLLEVGGISAF